MDPTPDELRAFIEKWRKVIAGDSPTAEPWAIQFEEEAAALLEPPTRAPV